MLDDLLKISGGNPGALKCLMGIIDGDAGHDAFIIMITIENLKIYGTDLYVLEMMNSRFKFSHGGNIQILNDLLLEIATVDNILDCKVEFTENNFS